MPRAPRHFYGKHGKYLRWHIITLYFDCGLSPKRIAKQLNGPSPVKLINKETVRRLIVIFEDTSDVKTPCGGVRPNSRRRRIPDAQWDFIISCIIMNPAFFLYELQELVETNYNNRIPLSTLCANLNREGWTLRVLQQRCVARCIEDETHWRSMQRDHDARKFMFADFCHTNPPKRHRRRGRGQRGQRTHALYNWTWGRNLNVMGVLALSGRPGSIGDSLGGVVYRSISYANANAETALLIVQDIAAMMRPYNGTNFNSVLCLDNASYYQDHRIRTAVANAGGRLLYIPPGAKELNPIEEAWSQLMSYIERERSLAQDRPVVAVHNGLARINHLNAEGYFRHAGWEIRRSADVELALALGYR